MKNKIFKFTCLIATFVFFNTSHAIDLPNKPIRFVVPFAAGGTADALARILAEKIRPNLKQTVIVENRIGAGGNIGAEFVFRSEPDGTTLLVSSPGPIAINHGLYPKLTFDPTKWLPVAIIGSVPNALVVSNKLPVNSASEFINYSKINSEKITYASQGNGTTSHLTAKMFEVATGSTLIHIPYKGDSPALTDLAGSQVDSFFTNISAAIALHKASKVRILAVADSKRSASIPDIPTFAELNLPTMNAVTWYAVVAPPGTSPQVLQVLNSLISDTLRQSDVKRQLSELGLDVMDGTSDQATRFIRSETDKWQKVIRDAKVIIE